MVSTELKEGTKDAHIELEKIVVQQLKAIQTKDDYARLLKFFYAFFREVEKAIAPFMTSDVVPDYSERRNANHLKADIESLGGDVDKDIPKATAPSITNKYQALGALYVMEGSVLGGKTIVKMLEKYNINSGISFFSGYGDKTPALWGRFIELLNQQITGTEQQRDAIQTAKDTFTLFAATFSDAPVLHRAN
jgi:heme oxygenase (biliverdin-IX-beta and delta-forming)